MNENSFFRNNQIVKAMIDTFFDIIYFLKVPMK